MNPIETVKISDKSRLSAILSDFRVTEADRSKIYKHIPLDPQNSIHFPLSLAFEVIDKTHWKRPSVFVRWLKAIRILSLSSSVMPCLISLAMGLFLGLNADWWVFGFALLGVISLHIGVNFLNDYDDHLRLLERPDFQGTRGTGGSGVIQKAWIPAINLKRAGLFCLVLGILFGVPALLKNPLAVGILGAVGVIAALGYSGWPLRLKWRAFGDGAVVLLLGPGVMVGSSLAAFNQVPLSIILAGVFFGFLAEGALHANNLQDIPLDTNRKITTLAMTLGFKKAKIFLILVYLTSYSLLFFLAESLNNWTVFLAVSLVSPYAIMFLYSVFKADGPLSYSICGLKRRAEYLHLSSSILMLLSLLTKSSA